MPAPSVLDDKARATDAHPAQRQKSPGDLTYAQADEQRRVIQARLQAKLEAAKGVDWELLSLEFRRDLLILADEFGRWARYLDSTFDTQAKSPGTR
jgi:hypothetical protein